MIPVLLSAALAATLAVPAPRRAPADSVSWKIDVTHSELTFRVRHLVSRVPGTFKEWSGTITADPANWNAGAVTVTIQAASVDTKNDRRDTHLRSPDFFDAATYPTLTFRSTSVTVKDGQVTLAGDLTIRDVTKPVTLTGEFLGLTGEGPGKQRAGFHVGTTINRLDYGLKWNRAVEGGGLLLGDDVQIDIFIEAVRQ